jgi:hypothetical protein
MFKAVSGPNLAHVHGAGRQANSTVQGGRRTTRCRAAGELGSATGGRGDQSDVQPRRL